MTLLTRAARGTTAALVWLAACGRPALVATPALPPGLALSLAPCAADDAATPPVPDLGPDERIASVTVHGAGAEIGDVALHTQAGAPFDRAAARADLHALWGHSVASRVALTALSTAAGYALAFEVTPARRVIRVELDGVTRDEVPRLAVLEGTLHDGARLARLVASVTSALRDRGHLRASLDATAYPTCDGVVILVSGSLGPRYRVRSIRATGTSTPVTPAELEDDLGHANVAGGAYARQALDVALTRILAREQEAGYFAVTGDIAATPDDEAAAVDVELRISEGPRMRIAVAVDGGTPALRALVAGRLATFDGTTDFHGLRRAADAVDKELARLGQRAERSTDDAAGVYRMRVTIAAAAPARETAP